MFIMGINLVVLDFMRRNASWMKEKIKNDDTKDDILSSFANNNKSFSWLISKVGEHLAQDSSTKGNSFQPYTSSSQLLHYFQLIHFSLVGTIFRSKRKRSTIDDDDDDEQQTSKTGNQRNSLTKRAKKKDDDDDDDDANDDDEQDDDDIDTSKSKSIFNAKKLPKGNKGKQYLEQQQQQQQQLLQFQQQQEAHKTMMELIMNLSHEVQSIKVSSSSLI